jgi:hypothetical protein
LTPIWNCERETKGSVRGKRNTDILEVGEKGGRWRRTVFRAPGTAGSHWRAKTTLWRASIIVAKLIFLQSDPMQFDQLPRVEFLTLLGGAAATVALVAHAQPFCYFVTDGGGLTSG